jgi:hypothetical protein
MFILRSSFYYFAPTVNYHFDFLLPSNKQQQLIVTTRPNFFRQEITHQQQTPQL